MAGLPNGIFTRSTGVTKNPKWWLGTGNELPIGIVFMVKISRSYRVLQSPIEHDFNNFIHVFEVVEFSGVNG